MVNDPSRPVGAPATYHPAPIEGRLPYGDLLTRWQEERSEWHRSGIVEIMSEFAEWLLPIPMVLHCPTCGKQHIDRATAEWDNPPHRSHLCETCGTIWRPADVPTVGVEAIETRGANDCAPYSFARGGAVYVEHGRPTRGVPRKYPEPEAQSDGGVGFGDVRRATRHASTLPGPVNCLLRIQTQHGKGFAQRSKCERCGGTAPEACVFFEPDGTAKQAESPCSDLAMRDEGDLHELPTELALGDGRVIRDIHWYGGDDLYEPPALLPVCTKPLAGYRCTLGAGHEGPCDIMREGSTQTGLYSGGLVERQAVLDALADHPASRAIVRTLPHARG